jgi:dipeptidyl aminopeptidase/acylaminoacyl peptidase
MVVFGLGWKYIRALTQSPCQPGPINLAGYQSEQLVIPGAATLSAWWHPSQNGAVIILLGGHLSTRDSMLTEAQILVDHGYGVLLPSSSGCSGTSSSFGINETRDLDSAVKFVKYKEPSAWIGVVGFSAGGVAAIRESVYQPDIRAVVAIGNYANLWQEIQGANPPTLSLEWQFQQAVALLLWGQFGTHPTSISPLDDLPRLAPRPLLLIHGEREISRTRGYDQWAAALPPKELWVVSGADHGEYLLAAPEEYPDRILKFFETWRGEK